MTNSVIAPDAAVDSTGEQLKPFPYKVGQAVNVYVHTNPYASTSETIIDGWTVTRVEPKTGWVTVEGKLAPESTSPNQDKHFEQAGVIMKWDKGIEVGTVLEYDAESNFDAVRDHKYTAISVDPSKDVELELVFKEGTDSEELRGYKKSLPWKYIMSNNHWKAVI